MEEKKDIVRKESSTIKPPELINILTDNGIEISGDTFLLSPLECCAQTLLPFWAKVIGRIKNCTAEEIFIRIDVNLFDSSEKALGKYSDIIILDAGQKGEFDIKLTVNDINISKYSIEAEAIDSF
jgi:hypothetical protein